MNELNINSLDMFLERMVKLKELLTAPEIANFLKLLAENKNELVIPIKQDKLIGTSQAAEVLGVAENSIGEYVKNGLLTPLYTPPASHRKFWLSDVMAIPRKEVK